MDKLDLDGILAIPINRPDKLFTPDGIELQYRRLRSKWHPDKNDGLNTNEVFIHLTTLYESAVELLANNEWPNNSTLVITDSNTNKKYNFKYLSVSNFELGKVYVGKNYVAYVGQSAYATLFDNAVKRITAVKYPNSELKSQFQPLLPDLVSYIPKSNLGCVLILKKPASTVMLADLVHHMAGFLPERHTAWVIGATSNIVCFLDKTQQITHLGITPTNVFVDPTTHACYLLGGWWYATSHNQKMLGMPATLLNNVSPIDIADKKARCKYDQIAIRLLAFFCLGDLSLTGSRLIKNPSVPKPLLQWLRSQPTNDSVAGYASWSEARDASFGTPKFIDLNITTDDVYPS
jgi:hypothetical protein